MMEIVKHHMTEHGAKQLKKLKIRVGALTAVDPQSLVFCFEVYTHGTSMEGAILEIEDIPLMGRCNDCHEEFRIDILFPGCPRCSNSTIEHISGHELDIVSMEVE